MRAAAIGEIAAQGLASIEAVAVDPADGHQGGRLGDDHFRPGAGQGQVNAKGGQERAGLGAGGDHDGVAAKIAGGGLDHGDAAPGGFETHHRAVLADATAQVLQRPGIGLHRALRIGVAAELHVNAAEIGLADQGRHFAHLLRIQVIGGVTQGVKIGGHIVVVGQLGLGEGRDHPLAAVFGGIAEEVVHHRPKPLLLRIEGTVGMGCAAAVAP